MKKFERILIKLIVIQMISLFAAQWILLHTPIRPYLTKIVEYEGVSKNEQPEPAEGSRQ